MVILKISLRDLLTFQLQKRRNSDVDQSVEQKVQLVDIGYLVCLLELKINHFSSFSPDTFRSNFLKKTLSRDLLTQKPPPKTFR